MQNLHQVANLPSDTLVGKGGINALISVFSLRFHCDTRVLMGYLHCSEIHLAVLINV